MLQKTVKKSIPLAFPHQIDAYKRYVNKMFGENLDDVSVVVLSAAHAATGGWINVRVTDFTDKGAPGPVTYYRKINYGVKK